MLDPRILTTYTDALGAERSPPAWAVDHVNDLLAEERADGGFVDVVRVVAGTDAGPLTRRVLLTEDGGEVSVGDRVPDDLAFGYHQLDGEDGPVLVLHAPSKVPSPGAHRGWVIAAQLYAARSERSWGHGDLGDARQLAAWIGEAGSGGHLMLNPLHAPLPGASPQPSPYFASSRIFRNPMYLSIDDIPGSTRVDVESWRGRARQLDNMRLIDRAHAWEAKRAALAEIWAVVRSDPAVATSVDSWLADPVHRDYATFCVASASHEGERPPARSSEQHGTDASDEHRFHAWLQLLLLDQLAGVDGPLVHDVAVGTDRAGADTWLWPDCFVLDGTRIGCPPDQFNTRGQDWGLPPLHPSGLRAAGLEPFVRAIRSAVTGAAGIRIDHVMGLERLFWIPSDGEPADGVYVRYPLEELLDVVTIEAHRAGAFVVGEDLGTVPPSIPEALGRRGILSYRVASLGQDHPSTFPPGCMAALTTHDLPTTVGLLSGSDLADQHRLDMAPNDSDTRESANRLRDWAQVPDDASDAEVVAAAHRLLATSPAQLVAATLEDMALVAERPNMPGTIDAWPNWSIGLPAPLDEVLTSDLAVTVRDTLAARATQT